MFARCHGYTVKINVVTLIKYFLRYDSATIKISGGRLAKYKNAVADLHNQNVRQHSYTIYIDFVILMTSKCVMEPLHQIF